MWPPANDLSGWVPQGQGPAGPPSGYNSGWLSLHRSQPHLGSQVLGPPLTSPSSICKVTVNLLLKYQDMLAIVHLLCGEEPSSDTSHLFSERKTKQKPAPVTRGRGTVLCTTLLGEAAPGRLQKQRDTLVQITTSTLSKPDTKKDYLKKKKHVWKKSAF